MINSLRQLSIEADGRYATDEELSFLTDYLDSVQTRISAYDKVRDNEETILEKLLEKIHEMYPKVYLENIDRIQKICRRDVSILLRCMMASTLFDDLDRTRNTFLLWHKTIARASRLEQLTNISCQLAPVVLRDFLNGKEIERTAPALQLAGSFFQ